MESTDASAAPAPPILRRESLREQATQVIRARIVSGQLRPGVLHAVGRVAGDLGVSITPIREALLDLAKQGLVEMVRNRGFRVRTLTERDLDEILQLRQMLEIPAVREIAARRLVTEPAELRRLSEAIQRSAADGDWPGIIVHDQAFHLGLLGHLGNTRLVETVGRLRDQSRLYGLATDTGTERFRASMREHDDLLDAVVAGDAERAADVMARHLLHTRGIWAGR